MISLFSGASGVGTFPRGVHPPEAKEYSRAASIAVLPTPDQVQIALLQHTGAPAVPTVQPRTDVVMGDMLADGKGFISAAVHASISGKTAALGVTTLPNGRHVQTIPIKAATEQPYTDAALLAEILGGDWECDSAAFEPQAIRDACKAAGIVGQGGAAFPAHVKFSPPEGKPIDTVLVNGCECEPYLTADERLMIEAPAPILAGARLIARAVGASRVIVGIEDNKPEALERMRAAAADTDVEVMALRTKYPMGGEKQLIRAMVQRTVPTGGLPLAVGVVVTNVGTSAAVARAVLRGKPLTHRVITVTGAGIRQPKNVLAPIGVSFAALIDFCGGFTEDAARVIAGGPMMGFALGSLEVPVTKGTSGITILTQTEVERAAETACIRCGRCVDVCPLGLVPTRIALAARHRNWEQAERHHIMACMECGCCAYTCPASIPLVQLIRSGKVQLIKRKS
ncbi:MAG: electron transport complex subunit RsxC [Verrucomicrobiota bacterium]|jgi:electron transport complex protein RnfC